MEKIQWKVEGMDCTTCAINIHRYLEKQGMKNVRVNFATGDVAFEAVEAIPEDKITKGIQGLGYKVIQHELDHAGHTDEHKSGSGFLSTPLKRFLFCLPFTAVLMLHMIPGLHIHWLMNPWLQLSLT